MCRLINHVYMHSFRSIMYQSNRGFNIPPPGIPRAFDVFFCPGGGNLINFIFPGAGIYSLGVGNLIASLDFMLRVALIQAVHEGR